MRSGPKAETFSEKICVTVKCACLPHNLIRDRDCKSDLDHYTALRQLNVTEETHAVDQEVTRRNLSQLWHDKLKNSLPVFLSPHEINKQHTIHFHFPKLPFVISQRLLPPTVITFLVKFTWYFLHRNCLAWTSEIELRFCFSPLLSQKLQRNSLTVTHLPATAFHRMDTDNVTKPFDNMTVLPSL
jgi:hypothetical protein